MQTTALLFSDIFKFNPYHDRLGLFASANNANSFSAREWQLVGWKSKKQAFEDRKAGKAAPEKEKPKQNDDGSIKIKEWVLDKAQETATRYNTFIDFGRKEDGTINVEDGFVSVYPQEILAVTDKAIQVRLGSGNVIGSYKGWKTWIPRSALSLKDNELNEWIENFKKNSVAKSFSELMKFNMNHDELGRFSTAANAVSVTIRTQSKLWQNANNKSIERAKERHARTQPTEAQNKTLKGIENRTRNLKKEQFRVVDRDGNVVMTKQGDKNSVSYTMGEAREHFPGNITIHNHPTGGTFSTADLSDFGHGATEIRAAAPEGTYTLRNFNYGTKLTSNQKTWFDMREDLEAAALDFKSGFKLKKEVRESFKDEQEKVSSLADKFVKAMNSGASQDILDSYHKEYDTAEAALKVKVEAATRKAYTDQYDNWYKQNAMKYGLEYEFVPAKTKTKKSFYDGEMLESVRKSDDIVLDDKFNKDIAELVEKIMNELIGQKKIAKSFSELMKFNPYHDEKGWFATANNFKVFSANPDTTAGRKAIERASQNHPLIGEAYKPTQTFGSKITGTSFKKPKLESEEAEQNREKALSKVERYFSTKGVNKEKYDEKMKRYLEETDPAEWEKRARKDVFSIGHNFVSAKTPKERAEEEAQKKDHLSRMNAKDRAAGKRTQAHQRYIEYERSLKEKYPSKDMFDRTSWYSRATEAERAKLQELDDARVFRNKRGQWQIAKSFSELMKFNPYHDRLGMFSTAANAALFTYAPGKSKAHDMAIERERMRTKEIESVIKNTDKMASYVIDSNFISSEKKSCVKDVQAVYQKIALQNGIRWSDEKQKIIAKRGAVAELKETARKIMEKQEYEDTSTSQDYYELHRTIKRTPIKISDYDKANIPDWNDYRKRAFGNLTISNNGISIDSLYQELSSQFPHLFDSKREPSPSDQLEKLNEVLTSLRPRKYTLKGKELEDAADDLALQMMNGYMAVIKPAA